MTLDFTQIPDKPGVALYMLHNGTVTQQRSLQHLAEEIEKLLPGRQIVLLSHHDRDGERIRDFYDLDSAAFPHVLLIRDNDQIAHQWSGLHLPTADHLAYIMRGETA